MFTIENLENSELYNVENKQKSFHEEQVTIKIWCTTFNEYSKK